MRTIEDRTCRHLMLTIGLFCSVQLFLNFLDRSNISYAALQMNAELGIDPKIYGFAIGMFFIGHILFSLPAAELARRFGARAMLATIIIVWGIIAALMSLVQNVVTLCALRLCLGLAEAGASSIVTLLMTNWIPRRAFGRNMMLVTVAQPIGQIVGGPVSGLLMTVLNGYGGHSGWRWMFVVEGLVTVLFGVFAWFWVRNSPQEAHWLDPEEKRWLVAELERDAALATDEAGHRSRATLKDVLLDLRIWIFGVILFCIATGIYLFTFWLPQVLQQDRAGTGTLAITALSAVPWAGMMVGMMVFGWSSDRFHERPRHLAAGMLIGALGLALGIANAGSPLGLLGLTVAAFGLGAAVTVFWTMPPSYMAGTAGAAPAFAVINLIGNVTGVVTPIVIGWLRFSSGSFQSSLYLIIIVLVIGTALILPVASRRRMTSPILSQVSGVPN